MTQTIEFDADARARESVITIGGRKFRPRKMTGDVFERLVEIEAAGPPDDATDRARSLHNIRSLNRQIGVLIVDADTGKPPTDKFLDDNLGLDEAVDLLALLSPQATEGGPGGNDGPAAPSTE